MRCPSCGFETPDFHAVVSLVIMQLQQERRITYRAIQRTFGCDDAFLEDVREELILAKHVAYDEGGKVLVWRERAHDASQPTLTTPPQAVAVETADVTSASSTVLSPLAARSKAPLDQSALLQPHRPLAPTPQESPVAPVTVSAAAAESQLLTVLFCDVVGSTQLSGQLDPEDLREIMRAYQQASVEVIQRLDGHMAQYQGDGLLVYFGYPQSQPDDAQRAVRAGLGIIAAVDQINARLVRDYNVELAVRIGVHTGPVVLGDFGGFGGESQTDSFAVGETPTIAAGVQNVAAPGTVVVSRSTQELIAEAFTCEDIGPQTLKGVAAPIAVARVLQDRTAARADEAERRQLTVMFGELAELSALAAQVSSEILLEIVHEYQQVCTEVIERFDGHVAQYLENGVLVYFGYPLAHEDDAQRAVRAGLGMLAATQVLNTRLQQEHEVQLAMRIGIHTGPVVAGEMGGGSRTEQLAVGETPNVAARILGVATPGTLAISPTTAQLTAGYFEQEELGTYTLKGVAEPMLVWRITGESATQSRLELQEARGLAALVGRETEETLLAERWAQSQAGHGQVVLLSGEAGIGKSRLVEALREHVGRETATQIRFRCSPYYQSSALYPVVEHLQRLLRFQPDESAAARVEKIEQLLARYQFSDTETVPLLASLLSVPLPEDRYPPLSLARRSKRRRL
jgi:class 3 adenylate cyclase